MDVTVFVVVVVVIKTEKGRRESSVQNRTLLGLEVTVSTVGAVKGKQGKQRAHFTNILEGWQPSASFLQFLPREAAVQHPTSAQDKDKLPPSLLPELESPERFS